MWLFSKKSSFAQSGFFQGFTEMHCHVLPGVDDGVKVMEESLAVLNRYEELGIRKVWLTPHIMEDVPNETDFLKKRFLELKSAYDGSIELRLASENMLDNLFRERLRRNDFLPIGEKKNWLLVETSFYNPPMDLIPLLEETKEKGYFPLLAHPERYFYMSKKDYKRLKEMDILFQLNLGSLIGFYGPEVCKKAEWMLKNGMYNMTGCDTHRMEMLERIANTPVFTNTILKQMNNLK